MHALKHLLGLDGGRRTVRPLRAHAGPRQAALSEASRATLGAGDVAGAVRTPEGADATEWLATNATDQLNTCARELAALRQTPASSPPLTRPLALPRQCSWASSVTPAAQRAARR